MQTPLNWQRIKAVGSEVAFVVEILTGEACADTDMTGEEIGDTEF